MGNLDLLKRYLVGDDNPYLLNEENNGKCIMLSGEWGSGKTHFWKNVIVPELERKMNQDKALVYVSLYGKETLRDIKSSVYLSASGKNILSKDVSAFGIDALSAIKDSDLKIGQLMEAGKNLYDSRKINKGISKLKNGGIVCFDDFERKSNNVDLNDLFGFITQLIDNFSCKVVVILNSDVFESSEANVFKNVKEKTVNKFLHFSPSINELFDIIFNQEKYSSLSKYNELIRDIVQETGVLNARVYMQTLDNVKEWASKKEINPNILRVLVLSSFNYILNHLILDYKNIKFIEFEKNSDKSYIVNLQYEIDELLMIDKMYGQLYVKHDNADTYRMKAKETSCKQFILHLLSRINGSDSFTEGIQDKYLKWIEENEKKLCAIWKYGHQLYYVGEVDEKTYREITKFIKTGILI